MKRTISCKQCKYFEELPGDMDMCQSYYVAYCRKKRMFHVVKNHARRFLFNPSHDCEYFKRRKL